MDTRNVAVTLEKAREWYNSGNATLKEVALQAFNESELKFNFKDIISFEKACKALDIDYSDATRIFYDINRVSRASAAMFKLNIIRKALNLGEDLHLTKESCIYYPYNPFITTDSTYYDSEIESGDIKIIGKIKNKGTMYYVLGNCAHFGGVAGLGGLCFGTGVGFANATVGFLGCASEEIAQHFSKYFGMLITEAKYGDMVDFEYVR